MSNIDPDRVRQVHFFSVLDEAQFHRVLESTRTVRLGENERLFDHGQPAERFYLVIRGQIKLFRVSEEGNEKIIEIIRPGQLFAEAVMFMLRQRYPVHATALSPTLLYSFDNGTFLDLLRSSNTLCLTLLGMLSMRLHYHVNEIDKLTLQNATLRVVGYLLEQLPDPRAGAAVIELAAPKHSIASRLSITPETLSRILNGLARDGVLQLHGKTIAIADTERLRDYGRAGATPSAGQSR